MLTALRLLCNSLRPIEGSDLEMTLAGYRVALEGCPAWAIANAVRRFLQNKVPHQNKVFCPRAPELRAAVDAEMAPVMQQIEYERRRGRLRDEQSQLASPVRRTDGEKARAAQLYAEFCDLHAQACAGDEGAKPRRAALDPEKLAMVPDAPTTFARVGWLNRGGQHG